MTAPVLPERVECARCCTRAGLLWAGDELLATTLTGRPMPTVAIDELTPPRAKLMVLVCLAAGGRLEHGTPELFGRAVDDAAHTDPGATGWWRPALAAAGQL